MGKDELNILRVILVQTGVISLEELYQTLCSIYFVKASLLCASRKKPLEPG